MIVLHPDEAAALAAVAGSVGPDALICAPTNEKAAALNRLVRADRIASGVIDESAAFVICGKHNERVSAGDVVQTRRNNRELGVRNRDTWTVSDVTDTHVHLHNGAKRVAVPVEYAREFVHLADAVTVHGGQGRTVNHSVALVDDGWDRRALYVALTRGRESNMVHMVASSLEDATDQLRAVLTRAGNDTTIAQARAALNPQRGHTNSQRVRVGAWSAPSTLSSQPTHANEPVVLPKTPPPAPQI